MTVRHHAFALAPHAYLASVRSLITGDGVFDRAALRNAAVAVVGAASDATRRLLEILRYDEDWLADGEMASGREWLVLLLLPHLAPVPSLSGREPHAYHLVERVLPVAGVAPADASLLVRGASLDGLPAALGDPRLAPLFRGLAQYGGWIDSASLERLRAALVAGASAFLHPGPATQAALAEWLRSPRRPIEEALADAFHDALDMLDAGGGRALYVVFE